MLVCKNKVYFCFLFFGVSLFFFEFYTFFLFVGGLLLSFLLFCIGIFWLKGIMVVLFLL